MCYNFLHSDPYEHMGKNTKKRKENETSHTHTQLHTDKKKEPSSLQHLNLTRTFRVNGTFRLK